MNKKSKFKKYLLIFLFFYLFSYLFLSRTSLYLNEYHNLNRTGFFVEYLPYFYYIPVKEVAFKESKSDLPFTAHMILYYFYYPVYWIDYYLLSGPLAAGVPPSDPFY